jgi:hypothetical protein
MASKSLRTWRDLRRGAAAAFAELEHAHRAVGGTGPGRRHLTRQLNPDAIAEDFERLGLDVWARVDSLRAGGDERRRRLRELVDWRNAIAHDDVEGRLARDALRPRTVTLATCRTWRSALNVLASSLDRVAADQCVALGLGRPW